MLPEMFARLGRRLQVYHLRRKIWAPLVGQADLIVRAQVGQTESFWADGHTQIESRHLVQVRYALLGQAPLELSVHTVGGMLEPDGLAMVAPEQPTLADGEEVLLFLRRSGDEYSVAGDNGGKYLVYNGYATNPAFHLEMAQAGLYSILAGQPGVVIPADWQAIEAAVQPEAVVGGLDFKYNDYKWPVNTVEYVVNVNSQRIGPDTGDAEAFLAAITGAAWTWNLVPEADFNLIYTGETDAVDVTYNKVNEVVFVDRGEITEDGYLQPLAVARVYFFPDGPIIETDIWVNDAYQWDATGSPDRGKIDLQSVVLHEMGHWLSLGHDNDSGAVMYPTITLGTLKRVLHDNDRRGIIYIYPCQEPGDVCNLEPPTPSPTPSPTPTNTPTPTPTPTSTPTPLPTSAPITGTVSPDAGGMITFTSATSTTIHLEAAAGAVVTSTQLEIRQAALPGILPRDGNRALQVFSVIATRNGEELEQFEFVRPVTLTIGYLDDGLEPAKEAGLLVYAFLPDLELWEDAACGPVSCNAMLNRLELPICHLSTFGVFEPADKMVYLPTVQR